MPATLLRFLRRYPLPCFYIVVFCISWGAVLWVARDSGFPIPAKQFESMLPKGIAAMLIGPVVASLLMTATAKGRRGFTELLSNLSRWRVAPPNLAIALLLGPVAMIFGLVVLSLVSPNWLPAIAASADKSALLVTGLLAGLAAGVCEEIGWTGFALPLLRQRYSVLQTGLIMGFLWGAWHLIVNFWGSGDANGALDSQLLLPSLLWSVAILPPYRVMMVWVYERTPSLSLAMLMHMSLTSSMILLTPAVRHPYAVNDIAMALLLAIAATVLVALSSRQRSARMSLAH